MLGDAVNVAARLEQAAAPGEVLIGESTYRLVRDAVDGRAGRAARGEGQVGAAGRLPAARGERARAAAAPRPGAPLVGRGRELALLEREFDGRRSEQRCRLVTVVGEPGVGKSRLAAELVGADRRAGAGRARRLSLLRRGDHLLGGRADRARARRDPRRGLGRGGARTVESCSSPLGRIAQLLGLAEGAATARPDRRGDRGVPRGGRAEQPLVVLVDDIHWAEPALLDLLARLPRGDRGAAPRCSAWRGRSCSRPRPTGRSRCGSSRSATPRSTRCSRASTRRRRRACGSRRRRPATRSSPRSSSRGCARAATLDDAADEPERAPRRPPRPARGQASATRSSAARSRASSSTAAPSSSSPTSRRVRGARRARRAHPQGHDPPGRGQLRRRDVAFRFKHILVRDAAYRATAKKLRATLHERFADWLERLAGERVGEYQEILGYHLEQAYRYRTELGRSTTTPARSPRAPRRHLGAAGRRANDRGDVRAAVNLLGRATALLPADSVERLELLLPYGYAAQRVGANAGGPGDLRRAVRAGNRARRTRPRRARARQLVSSDSGRPGRRPRRGRAAIAEEVIETFAELGDEAGLARPTGARPDPAGARAGWPRRPRGSSARSCTRTPAATRSRAGRSRNRSP